MFSDGAQKCQSIVNGSPIGPENFQTMLLVTSIGKKIRVRPSFSLLPFILSRMNRLLPKGDIRMERHKENEMEDISTKKTALDATHVDWSPVYSNLEDPFSDAHG
jgi:hypothetical protein